MYDAPTAWRTVSGRKRRAIDEAALWALLHDSKPSVAVIEQPIAMPRQSAQSGLTTGYGFGLYIMALTALGIPYEVVRAQRWKAAMLDGTARDKAAALVVARRLFPGVEMGRRKDAGRAEALLIAEYRRRQG